MNKLIFIIIMTLFMATMGCIYSIRVCEFKGENIKESTKSLENFIERISRRFTVQILSLTKSKDSSKDISKIEVSFCVYGHFKWHGISKISEDDIYPDCTYNNTTKNSYNLLLNIILVATNLFILFY
jgi:flagellar biosynthesis protein FlhB